MIIIFLTGILVGFVVALPIGPVGILCMRKTLEFGLVGTVAVGLGTALADATYAGIAALGLATVSEFLVKYAAYVKVLGGLLLFSLAFKEYYSKNQVLESIKITHKGFISLIVTTFFLTLANPIGVATFIGLFALFGDKLLHMNHGAIIMVIGVFFGSMTWFLLLGQIIRRTQHLLPERFILSIRKISAILFAAMGAWAFLSL